MQRPRRTTQFAWPTVALLALISIAWAGSAKAADTHPAFVRAEPLQSLGGMEIDLRFPLGTWLRPGCRLPLFVRIKSNADRRICLGVVPELWLVDAQSAGLDTKQSPRVDFTRVGGGSWSEPVTVGTVTGMGAVGHMVALLPLFDDARQHLVVVAVDESNGEPGKPGSATATGQVLWRADLGKFLHELSSDQRLVVRASADPVGIGSHAGAPADVMQGAGAGEAHGTGNLDVPSSVTLLDQTTATPILVEAWTAEFPEDAAAWASADLVLLEDRFFAPGRGGAGNAFAPLAPPQRRAFEAWLTRGGQAVVKMPVEAAQLWALEFGLGRAPAADWQFRLDGLKIGPLDSPRFRSPSDLLQDAGVPVAEARQFPFVPLPMGFGTLTLAWPAGTPPAGDGPVPAESAAAQRVAWQQFFAARLGQREPRLQPRRRIDLEAYTQVFDPQTTRIPSRVIGQIWWFLAAVTGGFLLVGLIVMRRRPADDAAAISGPPPSASGVAGRVRPEWTAWWTGAAAVLAIGGVASLYGARPRLSVIEWRIACVSRDGRGCEDRYTYVNTLRTTGDVRLTPDVFPGRKLTDAVSLVAAQRDVAAESGRLSATGAAGLEGLTLESYRPILLRTNFAMDRLLSAPAGRLLHETTGGAPVLALNDGLTAACAEADWALVLEACPATQTIPRLPTDYTGSVVLQNRSGPGWDMEPLWVRGAQLNLPAAVLAQEDLYKPGALRWVFSQIRQITRAPVLVLFQRRTLRESTWLAGASATPAPLDDSLQITVVELAEDAP